MTRAMLAAMCGLVLITSPAATQQQPASRPVDAATAAAARRLLAVTGAAKLMLSTMESMIGAQRETNPQIPAAFWDAFMARARRDTTRLIDMLVPIYASHLTQSELEELVRFYMSPIGQRLTAVQPAIIQESTVAGQNWGELIARVVGDSLAQAQGNLPPNQ
jgi:uncharacterized protein